MQNVPEWLGEVLAQLTENKDANVEVLKQLAMRSESLDRLEESFRNQAKVMGERNESLLRAVADLKEFANSLYGPTSAFAQIKDNLDGIRRDYDKRFRELELAQEETDDHMREIKADIDERFREFSARLDSLGV